MHILSQLNDNNIAEVDGESDCDRYDSNGAADDELQATLIVNIDPNTALGLDIFGSSLLGASKS